MYLVEQKAELKDFTIQPPNNDRYSVSLYLYNVYVYCAVCKCK